MPRFVRFMPKRRMRLRPYFGAQSGPQQSESCARVAQLSGCRIAHL
jgi:hypothetical protein